MKKLTLLITLLLITFLVACSSNSSQPSTTDNNQGNTTTEPTTNNEQPATGEDVEIRFLWWGNQDRHDRTLALIEAYEDLNPHVSINPEFLGFGDYADRLATQVAGGNAPDIFQMVDRWLPMYGSRGQLANLQPFVDSGLINTEFIDQASLDPGYFQGELVGLSTGSNAFALVYDPELFAEAGVPLLEPGYTWEDFANTARQLSEALGTYGTYIDVNHSRAFGTWLLQQGQWLYNEDGTGLGWEDDQLFVDFMNFWVELQDEGVVPPADVNEAAATIENYLIVNKQAPMQIIHSNQIVAVAQAAGRDLEMTILPSGNDGTTGAYIRASLLYSMNPSTKHPEEVIKFMDWMTNSTEANDILQGDRGVPISSKIREHMYTNLERTVQQQFDYIDLISKYVGDAPPPPPPSGSELDNAFDRIFLEILYRANTPEKAVSRYKAEMLDIISRQ
ncbi:sugar ABC transporter substrate-binding protein [Anaerobacillus alkaliphilus]|uniref:Sugar ABC transporter substrate-binding protein n=1 Tax=Anaerobacillus alkaliphilus TaxID=1548597 RepID=A0A4Q0VTZ4_9BACI|nr:sugar ABC transporter substrate-binding protein [Anaerobacillus alkaliphilus]RXJ02114.1 sugar ABC transporter substrate-binding protein [Anaerobacillus alkaliphilus]